MKPKPCVVINMAMTADGKTATVNRRIAKFGSPRDHKHLLDLRATADAIMCGARTVDLERITLGPGGAVYRRLRKRGGLAEYPLRVIVSGRGTIDFRAELFRYSWSPILLITARDSNLRRDRLPATVSDVFVARGKAVDFAAALEWLARKWKVKRLLVEGGGELNGALFASGLVDEMHLTLCPVIAGGRSAPTIADGANPANLAQGRRFERLKLKLRNSEVFLEGRVKHSELPSPKKPLGNQGHGNKLTQALSGLNR